MTSKTPSLPALSFYWTVTELSFTLLSHQWKVLLNWSFIVTELWTVTERPFEQFYWVAISRDSSLLMPLCGVVCGDDME